MEREIFENAEKLPDELSGTICFSTVAGELSNQVAPPGHTGVLDVHYFYKQVAGRHKIVT